MDDHVLVSAEYERVATYDSPDRYKVAVGSDRRVPMR